MYVYFVSYATFDYLGNLASLRSCELSFSGEVTHRDDIVKALDKRMSGVAYRLELLFFTLLRKEEPSE